MDTSRYKYSQPPWAKISRTPSLLTVPQNDLFWKKGQLVVKNQNDKQHDSGMREDRETSFYLREGETLPITHPPKAKQALLKCWVQRVTKLCHFQQAAPIHIFPLQS